MKLAHLIPSIQARKIYRLWHSADECTRRIAHCTVNESEFKEICLTDCGSNTKMPSLDNWLSDAAVPNPVLVL